MKPRDLTRMTLVLTFDDTGAVALTTGQCPICYEKSEDQLFPTSLQLEYHIQWWFDHCKDVHNTQPTRPCPSTKDVWQGDHLVTLRCEHKLGPTGEHEGKHSFSW